MNVTFVSIDVVSIDEDKHSPQDLLDTLDHELGKEDSDWKIVFAHYPCYSGGLCDGFSSIRHSLLPIISKHNVDLYITGHDHNMQHWKNANGEGIGKAGLIFVRTIFVQKGRCSPFLELTPTLQ